MNKKLLLIIGTLLVVFAVYFFLDKYTNIFLFGRKGTVEELRSFGNTDCSRPIKVIVRPNPNYNPIRTLPFPSEKYIYEPVNPAEAALFCKSHLFIESEGILKVLQRPEVLQLISKYQYKEVSVVALKFELIKDKDFVNRLLPAYKGREIGCIIIVETPGEKKVYLEDEKLQTFEELDYVTFSKYLNNVSPADKQLFTENLH
ncbi:hypothetical protein HY029_05155 [Candidatus Gottesmanbacteria bacterium]|nr:hypothetical protein [Candidatus Gottesmanbacteria bacterium]